MFPNDSLLDDTIKKNICFVRDKIDNLKLEKVIEISGIDEFINDSLINVAIMSHDGTRISGGQLQRIGIARLYI